MKLAIMQPYFLPYVGYFQLVASVDKFVVYDDVSFIKKGWVNRNNLLVGGQAHLVTIPLTNGKRDVLIRDVLISTEDIKWRGKMTKTIRFAYSKAPMYESLFPWVEELIHSDEDSISRLNVAALKWICNYLSIPVEIVESSEIYENVGLGRAERLADICRQEGADHYVNAAGGRELYEQEMFEPYGIKLSFLDPELVPYRQGCHEFIPGLSILDVLMYNSPEVVRRMIHGGRVSD